MTARSKKPIFCGTIRPNNYAAAGAGAGAAEVAKIPGVVMDANPQLSLFAFHLEGPGLDTRDLENAATRDLMERVTRRGKVMLTGAMVGDRYLGRVCVLSFRTRRDTMETSVRHLAEESAVILAEHAVAGSRRG